MTLRARLQRAPLLCYFAVTFAWSWACWALSAAEIAARSAALVLPFFYSMNKKSV